MGDTFGGPRRSPDGSGRGRSQRELQDRASYDCQPAAGVSCLVALPVSLAMWWGIWEAAGAIFGGLA
ncbi:hypothetical protein ABT185_07485 [Streptomyces clavifer]|uniref:hypothetical protein n=1 Tax=Streptomyces clavifer TaxID=68188 RepID=UPI003332CA9A